MKVLKGIWWNLRQRIFPFRGMVIKHHMHNILLFLDDSTCKWLYLSHFEVFREFTALKKLIQPGDWIIDVGANYGYTACLFAEYCSPNGKVVAIEAAPHTVARMRKQINMDKKSNDIIVVSCAVGALPGIETMNVSFDSRQDCQFLSSSTDLSTVEKFLNESVLVQVKALDQILKDVQIEYPALIKIDVEGYELEVLKGAIQTLSTESPPWLFLEVQEITLRRNGGSSGKLLDILLQYYEDFYIFEKDHFVPVKIEQIQKLAVEKPYF